eukprot:GFUD01038280.1.p1 GENE.GFUD01038280.1~~GFUD01038280.1.p1  ORF type:complete len:1087 (+),score=284.35 GFUD01038280.1:432-3692(+)
MIGQTQKLFLLLSCQLFAINYGFEDMALRLSGGKYFEGGYVEIWKDGAWGALCDSSKDSWNKKAGDVVCQELGFVESLNTFHGDTNLWRVPSDLKTVSQDIECDGGEKSLSNCKVIYGEGCKALNVVSVLCRPESKSACGPGAVAMLGSCYQVFEDVKSFPDAQQECQKLSANLLEISDELENVLVGTLVTKTAQNSNSFWTGGVVNEILSSKFKIWHGSQKQITFDNNLDVTKASEKPKGVVFKSTPSFKSPIWETEDFETLHAYICKFGQADIGCLDDDDETGIKYSGKASHDRDGNKCGPWNEADPESRWTHNYCRNPDEEAQPYCYLQSGEPSECNIFQCRAMPKRQSYPNLCESSNEKFVQVSTSCFKEEYSCKDRSCISKAYVCDGVKDCEDGDDEDECRIMASLFRKESGYKLEGITGGSESDTVRATEEECAKLCLYKKQDQSGCCDSFSHRPAKNGRDEQCILGTVYANQAFDSLVQKKSWNYFKLNVTQDSRNCRQKRPTGPLPLEGLRLMNRRRGSQGNIVEVKLNGAWGGICDDGFNVKEGNVICHQLGFHLGAKRVIKKANTGGAGKVLLGQVSCEGSEKSLADCNISDTPTIACPADQMVGIECKEAESVCEDAEFHCKSGECIGIDNLCDGIPNQCKDGSDELPLYCNSQTQVRLTPPGGSSGLLEVRHKGVWGTVCEDNFGQHEADVFCKMLGFEKAGIGEDGWRMVDSITNRDGSWPIWINLKEENTCAGSESSIKDCHDSSLWNHDYTCRHREDIFLTCQDEVALDFVPLDSDPAVRSRIDFETVQIVENCGLWNKQDILPANGDVPRIAGGVKVKHGTLPWQASIRLRGPTNRTYHHCGAVIISPFHLLTTAHCLWDYRNRLEIYYVRVGDNIIEIPDNEEQEFEIKKVDFHEDFGVGPYLNNDIAVVHIKKSQKGIIFGNKVGPACLPDTNTVYTPALNVTVSGWGKNSYDKTDRNAGTNFVSQLNMASVPIIDRNICKKEEVYGEDKISTGMFCAGLLEGGIDTCQGDSGGPAVSFLTLPKVGEVRATLVGLTSWGYGCGRANKPGVYTKVSKYVHWVYQKVKQQ